jgi:hypothetical protein
MEEDMETEEMSDSSTNSKMVTMSAVTETSAL